MENVAHNKAVDGNFGTCAVCGSLGANWCGITVWLVHRYMVANDRKDERLIAEADANCIYILMIVTVRSRLVHKGIERERAEPIKCAVISKVYI